MCSSDDEAENKNSIACGTERSHDASSSDTAVSELPPLENTERGDLLTFSTSQTSLNELIAIEKQLALIRSERAARQVPDLRKDEFDTLNAELVSKRKNLDSRLRSLCDLQTQVLAISMRQDQTDENLTALKASKKTTTSTGFTNSGNKYDMSGKESDFTARAVMCDVITRLEKSGIRAEKGHVRSDNNSRFCKALCQAMRKMKPSYSGAAVHAYAKQRIHRLSRKGPSDATLRVQRLHKRKWDFCGKTAVFLKSLPEKSFLLPSETSEPMAKRARIVEESKTIMEQTLSDRKAVCELLSDEDSSADEDNARRYRRREADGGKSKLRSTRFNQIWSNLKQLSTEKRKREAEEHPHRGRKSRAPRLNDPNLTPKAIDKTKLSEAIAKFALPVNDA